MDIDRKDFTTGDCANCGLHQQKERGNICLSYVPEEFNGLMIVGEGPGRQEVAKNTPFVGSAGAFLTAFLRYSGLNREECYITNATLCYPPPKSQALHDAFPTAIPSCLSRLEAEIAAVKPRVILPFGTAALIAITGYDKLIYKRRETTCNECDENRKVGPVLQCGQCKAVYWFHATCKEDIEADELTNARAAPCPDCGAKRSALRAKMIKCPACGGRKTETYQDSLFTYDYKISEVAGAIFTSGTTFPLANHEVDPWYGQQGVKYIIPTYHPAFVMRGNQFHAEVVVKHVRRAAWLLEHDPKFGTEYEVTGSPDKVRDFCFAPPVYAEEPVNLAVDIETEAWGTDENGERVQLDARKVENVTKITCIGFARDNRALVVDTRRVDPGDKDDALLQALYEVLVNPTIEKTYHNGMCYDLPVIHLVWNIPYAQQLHSYTDDTLTAHHALYPDEPHNLAHVTFSYTESQAWKPPRTVKGVEVHENFEELALYNARDVINTGKIRAKVGVAGGRVLVGGEMEQEGLSIVYEIDTKLNRIAVEMSMRGMPLDQERWDNVGEEAQGHLDQAIADARAALVVTSIPQPEEFNPFKLKAHLIPALYTQAGFNLPIVAQTKLGQASTSKDVIAGLMSQAGAQGMKFLRAVAAARDAKKILSTYIEGQRPWSDGRLHAQWKPFGTRTGRFSSSPNLQNYPTWLRDAIKAPEGRALVGADYAQLELRALAALAGDENLIERCLSAVEERKLEPDYDPHSYIASVVFDKTYTGLSLDDPKRKAMRTMVKAVIYALNYGAGDDKIVATIYAKGYDGPPVTVELVKRVRGTIFKEFKAIPVYRDKQLQISTDTGELRSPLHKRRRLFPCNDKMPIPITEVYNFPIQTVAADIMNEALIILYDILPEVDSTAFIFAQVHDAAYVECDEHRAPDVAKLVEDVMTTERNFDDGPMMTFNAAAHFGKTWGSIS